ncbi:hypothetical protein NA56DRAFT_710439 [Hyaloscypha hepaticicola]|uniref:Uncharacterized protein n=1 Tax=Hyaloscypha hepaticicola TaxID=2082293 RepID=A0A2J6PLU5_9HELO|nr:hypothetical protein NA56DRAFT_710439 [Hyaloscypha hepaticicola]
MAGTSPVHGEADKHKSRDDDDAVEGSLSKVDVRRMTAPQANPTATNYATYELPQHDYTQKVLAVPGQGNDPSILDPQKVVSSVLPSVRNSKIVQMKCALEACKRVSQLVHMKELSLKQMLSTPAASPLFDKSLFVKFAEMQRKMDEKPLEEVVEADYDPGDNLKEFKEKWKALRLEKRDISRPGWLHATSQCCPFHLLQATFPGDVPPLAPSRREILDFRYPAIYKKPSKTHIHLRTHKDAKVHEMSLETALLRFAKPGKLLLPVPQPKRHKANDRLYHYFQPINIKSLQHHISRSKTISHEYHFFPSRADDAGRFENCMAEIWLLLLEGKRVEIQVHSKGPKDRNAIIIEPYTNFEKICWVMEGPTLYPRTFGLVKPLSKTGEFHKRRLEVMKAVMDEYGAGLHVGGEDHTDRPSELKDDRMQDMDQDTTNLLAKIKASQEGGEAQAKIKMLPESLGSVPVPPALSTLSLEEQEMEDYRKLEEITGFRPPKP